MMKIYLLLLLWVLVLVLALMRNGPSRVSLSLPFWGDRS